MVTVDLITGFLGAGKTTFLHGYAAWLMRQGVMVGIVANDFGAVNVDRLLLQDLESDQCLLEQVVGGSREDWKRRLKAKLISLVMCGVGHILVEPSGLYDTETFFDVLCESPVDTLCRVGSVLAVVDATGFVGDGKELSPGAAAMLAGQLASCGCVVLSHTEGLAPTALAEVKTRLQAFAQENQANRAGKPLLCIAYKTDGEGKEPTSPLADAQYRQLAEAGYRQCSTGLPADADGRFSALFFMKGNLAPDAAEACLAPLFAGEEYGRVWRVKGFVATESSGWLEINATRDAFSNRPSKAGQQVLIVIGEGLRPAAITARLRQYAGDGLVQGGTDSPAPGDA